MSSNATPISPSRFAAALTSLPLPNLHLKAAELRNSIAHLEYSNLQLKPFADEGDRVCDEAVEENKETIMRMEERIMLLKAEVEGRGFRWGGDELGRAEENKEANGNGRDGGLDNRHNGIEERAITPGGNNTVTNGQNHQAGHGRLSDEELARRLRERMAEDSMNDEDDGLHL